MEKQDKEILEKAVLEVSDMMKLLNVGKTTFYRYLEKGYIPKETILPLGVLRFKTAEVKRWLGITV